jgi:outer membrane protein assembly factor BamD
MLKNTRILVIGLVVLAAVSSCGDYNKILKSTDYEFKHKKAIEYYEAGSM